MIQSSSIFTIYYLSNLNPIYNLLSLSSALRQHMISNQYTKDYQNFKTIGLNHRLDYNRKICAIQMNETDFDFREQQPDYYHYIKTIENGEPIDLAVYVWAPKNPSGIIFLFHGFNGYIGTLSFYAKQLKDKNNLVVIGFDYRNFGRSEGKDRGLIRSMNNNISDAQSVIELGINQYRKNNQKIFLSGLSMGGSVVFKIAIKKKYDYSGVIFFSPGFITNPVNKMNLGLIHYFKILFMPTSYLFPPTYSSGCRHKLFMERVKKNPYIYNGSIRAGSIMQLGKYIGSLRSQFSKFDLPYLFVQSGVDKTVDPYQIIDFDSENKSTDKTHYFVKDMWHSVFFDIEVFNLVPEICKWIDLKIKKN